MPRRKVGRTRERLASILAQAGIDVAAEDLWMQEGFYRNGYHDLARWGSSHAVAHGKKVHLCSWDTMTECVKYGILEWEISRNELMIDISANKPIPPAK